MYKNINLISGLILAQHFAFIRQSENNGASSTGFPYGQGSDVLSISAQHFFSVLFVQVTYVWKKSVLFNFTPLTIWTFNLFYFRIKLYLNMIKNHVNFE